MLGTDHFVLLQFAAWQIAIHMRADGVNRIEIPVNIGYQDLPAVHRKSFHRRLWNIRHLAHLLHARHLHDHRLTMQENPDEIITPDLVLHADVVRM
jgi:hypothetical protein